MNKKWSQTRSPVSEFFRAAKIASPFAPSRNILCSGCPVTCLDRSTSGAEEFDAPILGRARSDAPPPSQRGAAVHVPGQVHPLGGVLHDTPTQPRRQNLDFIPLDELGGERAGDDLDEAPFQEAEVFPPEVF